MDLNVNVSYKAMTEAGYARTRIFRFFVIIMWFKKIFTLYLLYSSNEL